MSGWEHSSTKQYERVPRGSFGVATYKDTVSACIANCKCAVISTHNEVVALAVTSFLFGLPQTDTTKEHITGEKMYKLEMHLHTIGRSPCAKVDERTIAKAYAAQNYDGIVITNHFNRYLCDEYYKKGSPSDNVLFWLEAYYTLKRECAVYGIDVFLGMELLLDELTYYKPNPPHAETLVYGIEEKWLLAHPYDLFALTLPQLHDLCAEKGWLLSQAHPFRDGITALDPKYLEGAEIHNGHPRQPNHNDLAHEFVLSNGLLPTAGSDYHEEGFEGSGVYLQNAVKTNAELLAESRKRTHQPFGKDGLVDMTTPDKKN